jgi:hypothetical protein
MKYEYCHLFMQYRFRVYFVDQPKPMGSPGTKDG